MRRSSLCRRELLALRLFVALLAGVIVILSGLEFFPALALGPIVEHFQMLAGKTF